MTAKIPLFRELSAQAVLIIVFFKKKCRLVGETGLKLLDLFEVKFHFHLVEHKMPYVAVGMDLDSTPEKNSVPTIIVFIDQRSFSMVLMTFAGTPPTRVLSGTSFVTTAPAATTAFRPIVTPGQMVAPHFPLHVTHAGGVFAGSARGIYNVKHIKSYSVLFTRQKYAFFIGCKKNEKVAVRFLNNRSLPQFFEKVGHIIQIDIPASSGDPVA